jgi:hypothetical protein
MVSRRIPLWLAVAGVVAVFGAASSAEAENGRLSIELNQLENVDRGCRGAVIFNNETDATFADLAVEVAVFDQDDIVKNLWLLPARNMSPGTVRVRQFLFQEESCEDIGRILLNDVVNCETDTGLEAQECLRLIDASSRTDVPFVSTAGGGE